MTDTQALRDLLAKVEVGWPTDVDTPYMPPFHAVWPDWRAQSAWLANNGSLDAASALHDAVLPGFGWGKEALSGKLYVMEIEGNTMEFGEAATPARAWLICILRALIAQATP